MGSWFGCQQFAFREALSNLQKDSLPKKGGSEALCRAQDLHLQMLILLSESKINRDLC